MTTSEACSAAGAAGVQLDELVPLHLDYVSEGGYDRDGGHAEQLRDLQDSCDQPAGGEYALQQIQSLCKKAGLDVPSIVLKAQKPIAQKSAVISEKLASFATLAAGFDALKLEKDPLLDKSAKLKS